MNYLLTIAAILCFTGCGPAQTNLDKLPILGHKEMIDGDTIYHTIPNFHFTNQYGETITESTFSQKAYIVDYFFTSCPTICPKVKNEELKLYEQYKNHPQLSFLSVSIDPTYDTVDRLKRYAEKLEVEKGNWHFVTGDKDFIYDIADDFFHTAKINPEAEGGYDHDGKLILVDKNKHIRGFCDGLNPKDVQRFVMDIESLLNEK